MITRNRILFAIGLWNVLLPFLGFPGSYRTFFIIVSGLGVILLAFLYSRDKRFGASHQSQVQTHHETFRTSVAPAFSHAQSVSQPHSVATPAAVSEVAATPIQSPPQFTSGSRFGAPVATQERFTDLKSIINRTKTF